MGSSVCAHQNPISCGLAKGFPCSFSSEPTLNQPLFHSKAQPTCPNPYAPAYLTKMTARRAVGGRSARRSGVFPALPSDAMKTSCQQIDAIDERVAAYEQDDDDQGEWLAVL